VCHRDGDGPILKKNLKNETPGPGTRLGGFFSRWPPRPRWRGPPWNWHKGVLMFFGARRKNVCKKKKGGGETPGPGAILGGGGGGGGTYFFGFFPKKPNALGVRGVGETRHLADLVQNFPGTDGCAFLLFRAPSCCLGFVSPRVGEKPSVPGENPPKKILGNVWQVFLATLTPNHVWYSLVWGVGGPKEKFFFRGVTQFKKNQRPFF